MCVFFSLSLHRFSLSISPRRGTLSPPLSLTPRRGTFSSAMDASLRRHSSSPPALPDLAAVIRRRCEHESSSSESEMLSHSFYAGESSEVRLHPIGNSAKTSWTNEKHDQYLDHLESSFVKQLHRSILKNHPKSAGKQCFVRAAKMQDNSSAMNLYARDKNSFSNEAGLCTEQTFESHGYFEEFSDQNFPDEASEQMCVTAMPKRSKTIVS
ncbi:hypothetical protein HanRHA438_Chr03g0116491 [Helianthus annuus]|uniref:Uncharacterized protein n=1 Tax=Helianthus annuus TaxID=4232 RepID=A0A251V7M8_HELAN|nr:uncharacterized protein LOC110929633 [Helianthus annuus]XP_022028481.1 uncharacterized protein LOC110929633 [Helianthus annuus]XP_022028482.1 uncharacterized protein LOC110929633 [Helianthus annuus]KAF5814027.1 hypothetical protein HanXRQr2_Chr03g0105791 [Helianthus annuus]KAJ0600342.1 hypothetical protein HanIR_Chr03g0115481 [Helianthus annuus]KAJ0935221.1 hypothetical protein HanRHA438_Chr03g0116491 [Helianthus annuus]KAJ0943287.1 hypothetical protein HanPSC8_Chr03g0102341 [Helianthus an